MGLNTYIALDVPVGNGVGATTDVSELGLKTFIVGGTFNATVIIEGGINGNFAPLAVIDKTNNFVNVPTIVDSVRVSISAFVSGAPVVFVGGDPSTNEFGTLAVPVGNGVGAALDTSIFGVQKSLIVGGTEFVQTLTFEMSEDVNGPWAPFDTVDSVNNIVSLNTIFRFVRVRVSDFVSGVPTIGVAGGDLVLGITGREDLQTGVLTGGLIVINALDNTKFDVASGTGIVLNWIDPANPVRTRVSWNAFPAEGVANIATGVFTQPSIDVNGNLVKVEGAIPGTSGRRGFINLQLVAYPSGVQIDSIGVANQPAYEVTQAIIDYIRILGPVNVGNAFSANGANLLIDKASGSSTRPFLNRTIDPQNPCTLDSVTQSPIPVFGYSFRDGAGGFVLDPTRTVIDPDQFDDGSGILQAVGNNKWTIQRMYFNGEPGFTVIVYGQAEYMSQAEAEAAIDTEPTVVDPISIQTAIHVMTLVVKKGTLALNVAVDASFVAITTGLNRPIV